MANEAPSLGTSCSGKVVQRKDVLTGARSILLQSHASCADAGLFADASILRDSCLVLVLNAAVRTPGWLTAGHLLCEESLMGRGILLWLLGVPIPIILLLALLWH